MVPGWIGWLKSGPFVNPVLFSHKKHNIITLFGITFTGIGELKHTYNVLHVDGIVFDGDLQSKKN